MENSLNLRSTIVSDGSNYVMTQHVILYRKPATLILIYLYTFSVLYTLTGEMVIEIGIYASSHMLRN